MWVPHATEQGRSDPACCLGMQGFADIDHQPCTSRAALTFINAPEKSECEMLGLGW